MTESYLFGGMIKVTSGLQHKFVHNTNDYKCQPWYLAGCIAMCTTSTCILTCVHSQTVQEYNFPSSVRQMTQSFVFCDSLFVFQTSMSAVCRHTPAGMTVCAWTSREATTVCVRLVRAAAATARRKRGSDAMGKTGNPALTAVLYAPARYRGRTYTSSLHFAIQMKDF